MPSPHKVTLLETGLSNKDTSTISSLSELRRATPNAVMKQFVDDRKPNLVLTVLFALVLLLPFYQVPQFYLDKVTNPILWCVSDCKNTRYMGGAGPPEASLLPISTCFECLNGGIAAGDAYTYNVTVTTDQPILADMELAVVVGVLAFGTFGMFLSTIKLYTEDTIHNLEFIPYGVYFTKKTTGHRQQVGLLLFLIMVLIVAFGTLLAILNDGYNCTPIEGCVDSDGVQAYAVSGTNKDYIDMYDTTDWELYLAGVPLLWSFTALLMNILDYYRDPYGKSITLRHLWKVPAASKELASLPRIVTREGDEKELNQLLKRSDLEKEYKELRKEERQAILAAWVRDRHVI